MLDRRRCAVQEKRVTKVLDWRSLNKCPKQSGAKLPNTALLKLPEAVPHWEGGYWPSRTLFHLIILGVHKIGLRSLLEWTGPQQESLSSERKHLDLAK